ncbi:MAG TPA: aspartate aminotransferase family protein [Rhizomicrobium sp.]|nr:aspartate aminotransferase family protein [Rhizomicrobium sp.]
MSMINAYTGKSGAVSEDDKRLIARREAALGPAYRLFYETPVHFVRGEGVWLYDPDGNAYLDAYNNVASVGHCRTEVVEAIAKQSAILNTHTRYLNENIIAYSERLLAKFPSGLSHVMFTCTGSEANDLALRIAKKFTGGTGFVITEMAYHGGTDLVAGLSPSLGPAVDLGEHVRTVPAPDSTKIPAGQLAAHFANAIRAAIADMRRHGIKPAALIVDTIFSSDGVFSDPAGFLKEAIAVAREAGLLFIADEVQPGFGRTGDAMWGFERHGVMPDIVTLGKPMGNGYPIAGLVMKPEIVENFGRTSRYFNTFGGNPVACAAGMAVLDVIERNRLQQNAKDVGNYLREKIRSLASPVIADVRGAGFFIGVEIVSTNPSVSDAGLTAGIVNGLRERRVLISASGPRANVLKIRPPLIFSRDNADQLVRELRATIGALQ